jgi:hypothetical protein
VSKIQICQDNNATEFVRDLVMKCLGLVILSVIRLDSPFLFLFVPREDYRGGDQDGKTTVPINSRLEAIVSEKNNVQKDRRENKNEKEK